MTRERDQLARLVRAVLAYDAALQRYGLLGEAWVGHE